MYFYRSYWYVLVSIYLKSVVRYKFVTFDTYLPENLYIREQKFEDLLLFFETKRGS